MLDMIALAFQSDTTRISTFMFGNAVSGVNFRFLEGVTDSHHEISHHSNNPEKLRQYALINRWHVEQYAYLLRKLRDMKEGECSVLDNSMVLFGSALSDGNTHDPHPLALVVAARWTARNRPTPCLPGRYASGESVRIDARRFWRSSGTFRGQHWSAPRRARLDKSAPWRGTYPNRNSTPITEIRLSKNSTLTIREKKTLIYL